MAAFDLIIREVFTGLPGESNLFQLDVRRRMSAHGREQRSDVQLLVLFQSGFLPLSDSTEAGPDFRS
jgi:hypothetical protein